MITFRVGGAQDVEDILSNTNRSTFMIDLDEGEYQTQII